MSVILITCAYLDAWRALCVALFEARCVLFVVGRWARFVGCVFVCYCVLCVVCCCFLLVDRCSLFVACRLFRDYTCLRCVWFVVGWFALGVVCVSLLDFYIYIIIFCV